MSLDSSFDLLGAGIELSNLSMELRDELYDLSAKPHTLFGDLSGSISIPDEGFSDGAPSTIPRYPLSGTRGLLEEEDDPLVGDGLAGISDFTFDANGQMIDLEPEDNMDRRQSSEFRTIRSMEPKDLEFDILGAVQKRRRTNKDVRESQTA